MAAAESSATWSKMIDLGHIGRDYVGTAGVVPGSDWAGRVAVVVIVIVVVTARNRAWGRARLLAVGSRAVEGGARIGLGGPKRSYEPNYDFFYKMSERRVIVNEACAADRPVGQTAVAKKQHKPPLRMACVSNVLRRLGGIMDQSASSFLLVEDSLMLNPFRGSLIYD